MAKSIFEKLGGEYEQQGDYLIPRLTVPAEKDRSIGIWGAAASGLSEAVPQSYIHQSSHKWQTERLPRRHQRTGTGTLPQAHRGHEASTGHNGTAKGRKRFRMDRKDEQHIGLCKGDCK